MGACWRRCGDVDSETVENLEMVLELRNSGLARVYHYDLCITEYIGWHNMVSILFPWFKDKENVEMSLITAHLGCHLYIMLRGMY